MNVAVEIDIPVIPKYIISYRPGQWMYPIFGTEKVMIGDDEAFFGGMAQQNVSVIKSVRNGLDEMIPTSSIDENYQTGNSFYFGEHNGVMMMFFNISKNGIPRQTFWGTHLKIGIIEGFLYRVDISRDNRNIYNDMLYKVRVLNIPPITMKRDHLFFGKIQFPEGSVDFINSDGEFSGRNFKGNFIRIYGFNDGDEAKDWLCAYSGKVTGQKDGSTFTLSFGDKRPYLNKEICAGIISAETCPTVFDPKSDEQKYVPVAYNYIEKFEAIPIRETATAVRYKFCAGKGDDVGGTVDTARGIAHYAHSIVKIWYETSDDEQNVFSVGDGTLLGINLLEGWFEIHPDFALGDNQYEYETLYISFYGWHRFSDSSKYWDGKPWLNAAEIGLDLLMMFGNVQYNSANIDTQLYEEEREKCESEKRKISLLIYGDDDKCLDVIGKVCDSADAMFPNLSDGRYAFRFMTEAKPAVYEIRKPPIMNDLVISSDLLNVVTSTEITYGAAGGEMKPFKDKTREEEISTKHNVYNKYEKETILADKASVQKKSDNILNQSAEPRDNNSWDIPLDKENIILDCSMSVKAIRNDDGDKSVYDITSVKKDILGDLISIEGEERYKIDYSEGYIQGVLFGTFLFGIELYSETLTEV